MHGPIPKHRLPAGASGLFALAIAMIPMQAAGRQDVAQAKPRVDFRTQIAPILKQHCLSCHSEERHRNGLSLAARDALLTGGDPGPAVVTGDAGASLLIQLVNGDDPERTMPYKRPRLSADEISRLRNWIDAGLPWNTDLRTADAA